MAGKAKTGAMTVSLEPSPKAAEGAGLLQTAQALVITDKATHATCRQFIKDAKALRRTVADHYAAIKKPLNEARNTVLDMEKQHLAPIDAAIELAERSDVAFVREQQRIEQAEADRLRREAEAAEQARRDHEAAEAERQALALEESSEALSPREREFVSLYVSACRAAKGPLSPAGVVRAVAHVGYANPEQQAKRIMASPKIQAAIAAVEQATAIRRQSEAAQAAPIHVEVATVASEIASVAGTSLRTYYGCDARVDLKALATAVLSGAVPLEAIMPNMVYLNAQARMLKATFPSVYPGCKLSTTDKVSG